MTPRRKILTAAAGAAALPYLGAFAQAREWSDAEVAELNFDLLFSRGDGLKRALAMALERGDPDLLATMILGMRYHPDSHRPYLDAFFGMIGTKVGGWQDAMLWQEAHPEIVPHPSYRDIKLDLLSRIDPEFLRFLGDDKALGVNLDIRLEEITWGGVPVDGIPALDNPAFVSAVTADYLRADDLVFGVEINGDARAYPLRILGWHEMFNDVVGGRPVTLAYCTLCGAGILFDPVVPGHEDPLTFGSSGLLYRSNKLMYDRQTDSLWNQFTGQPISGPLRGKGIELDILPVAITTWAEWTRAHPGGKVLDIETGHRRDYGSGVVYSDYFASPDLMFPAVVRDETRVKRKDFVFGMRDVAAARAWPLAAFEGGAVINDRLGARDLVLIGDAASRSVRAYYSQGQRFQKGGAADSVAGPGGDWRVSEAFLIGPDGTRLARAPGHIAYWFAWDGYLGAHSTLYLPDG